LTGTHTLVVERELPHPQDKVWRALTQAPLIADWLMQTDFEPVVGKQFNLRTQAMAHWNGVLDCEVLDVEPQSRLAYSWNTSGEEAGRLTTVVTFFLTPTQTGVLVRMEQSGFAAMDDSNYRGAAYGWPKYLDGLERVAGQLEQ
jgi:uncharacterized protein YndB with AHSA1/START domain